MSRDCMKIRTKNRFIGGIKFQIKIYECLEKLFRKELEKGAEKC